MNKKAVIPFIDLLFCFLSALICIVMLLNKSAEKDPAFRMNVIYQVVLQWEGPADLDLWGKDPQGRIVGFNRREGGAGSLFALNRDCLGNKRTESYEDGTFATEYNEEIVGVRGTFMGEYVFNVHAYSLRESATPLNATIKLIKVKPFKEVVSKVRVMEATGDELTAFRFTVDEESKIMEIGELPASFIHGAQSGMQNGMQHGIPNEAP